MDDATRTLIRSAVHGAATVVDSPTGCRPVRLPDWALAQVDDPILRLFGNTTSGVRLSFVTSATWIALTALTDRTMFPGADPAQDPALFVATVGATTVGTSTDRSGAINRLIGPGIPRYDRVDGEPVTHRFDLGAVADTRTVEIWLPNTAGVEIQAVVADAPLKPSPRAVGRRWTHYGSSISQSSEADSPLGVWPVIAARRLGLDLTSLGLGGNAHLDQFVARMMRDSPADLISIKIGINVVNGDTLKRRTFVPALHGFLDTIREAKPATPILVISPILCPMHEDTPGPLGFDPARGLFPVPSSLPAALTGTLTLRDVRSILRAAVEQRRATDPNLNYLDGLALFGEQDLDHLPDGLHPDTVGYERIGRRFADRPEVAQWAASTGTVAR
jgi:hypothetical protein